MLILSDSNQHSLVYFLLVGLGPQSGVYGGLPGMFGDRGPPAGGCRTNNVR